MRLLRTNFLIFLSFSTHLASSIAQAVGQINDGQVQAPTSAATPVIQPSFASAEPLVVGPKLESTPLGAPAPPMKVSSTPPIIESAAVVPRPIINNTFPPAPPTAPHAVSIPEESAAKAPFRTPVSLKPPLNTANTSTPALATANAGFGGAGYNASAPTVPAVPSIVGASPTEVERPSEAGTSALKASAASNGAVRETRVEVKWLGWMFGVWFLGRQALEGMTW